MSDSIQPPPGTPSEPKTSALAIWSLVFGILSVATPCLAIFTVLPGIICGHMGLSRIKKSGGTLTGKGLATAGLITSYVGVVWGVFIFGFLMAIAVPNFVKARAVSQENACINNLRQIEAAKNEWALEKGQDGGAVPTEADLTPYLQGGKFPICPAGGTYTINAVTNNPTCTVPGHALEELDGNSGN
jgi:hypothetical protein